VIEFSDIELRLPYRYLLLLLLKCLKSNVKVALVINKKNDNILIYLKLARAFSFISSTNHVFGGHSKMTSEV